MDLLQITGIYQRISAKCWCDSKKNAIPAEKDMQYRQAFVIAGEVDAVITISSS